MSAKAPPGDYDEDGTEVWAPNLLGNTGSVGNVSDRVTGDTAVQRLREVVAEVTRGRIPVPPRRGPGFI